MEIPNLPSMSSELTITLSGTIMKLTNTIESVSDLREPCLSTDPKPAIQFNPLSWQLSAGGLLSPDSQKLALALKNYVGHLPGMSWFALSIADEP